MALLGKKTSELTPEEVEFLKEAAATLRREGEKLEEALQKLKEAEARLDNLYESCKKTSHPSFPEKNEKGPAEPAELFEAIHRYKVAWKRAERARYTYIVQREAIGFRSHKFADTIYPLPPLRKLVF